MNWLFKSLNSSIGKKILMALTGLSLLLFLTVHFVNNMFLFFGKEGFNLLVSSLDAVKPMVRVAEISLVLLFGLHIFNGIRLWWQNRKANPENYAVNGSKENSTFFSRTMPYTGAIILIFLIIHLSSVWVQFNFGMNETHEYYDAIESIFQSLPIAIFYIIAMVVLGFHLNHGFQSAFQTFGWQHKKYTPLVNCIGVAYSVVFAVGFAAIPIYFFIRSMGGN